MFSPERWVKMTRSAKVPPEHIRRKYD